MLAANELPTKKGGTLIPNHNSDFMLLHTQHFFLHLQPSICQAHSKCWWCCFKTISSQASLPPLHLRAAKTPSKPIITDWPKRKFPPPPSKARLFISVNQLVSQIGEKTVPKITKFTTKNVPFSNVASSKLPLEVLCRCVRYWNLLQEKMRGTFSPPSCVVFLEIHDQGVFLLCRYLFSARSVGMGNQLEACGTNRLNHPQLLSLLTPKWHEFNQKGEKEKKGKMWKTPARWFLFSYSQKNKKNANNVKTNLEFTHLAETREIDSLTNDTRQRF